MSSLLHYVAKSLPERQGAKIGIGQKVPFQTSIIHRNHVSSEKELRPSEFLTKIRGDSLLK